MNSSMEGVRIPRIFHTLSLSLSPAKMKWKVPLYVGIPPARRHGHTSFILHSHVSVPLNITERDIVHVL